MTKKGWYAVKQNNQPPKLVSAPQFFFVLMAYEPLCVI